MIEFFGIWIIYDLPLNQNPPLFQGVFHAGNDDGRKLIPGAALRGARN
jgi:hypothetical protein